MANKLKLGDIIQISAPADTDINEHIYYIRYIDENKIRLEEAGKETILTLTDGYYDNESIENIIIKSRAEEVGYARQNNLLPGVWIDLHFSGDLPLTLTGKITNLEKDKIEITTFPENDVIFIDFAYRGLPEDLPIEKIHLRKAPAQGIEGPSEAGPSEATKKGIIIQNEKKEDSLKWTENELDKTNTDYLTKIREEYWLIENIQKPLKAPSAYTLTELQVIAEKLQIETHMTVNEKTKAKTKTKLYEDILQSI